MHTPKKGLAATVVAGGWWQSQRVGGEVWREGVLKKVGKYFQKLMTFQYFRPSDACSNTFGGRCIFPDLGTTKANKRGQFSNFPQHTRCFLFKGQISRMTSNTF